ncbi:hypothetical protein [Arcicella rosea]|uniref:Putative tellurium resistance membrane protein TerC n=1 Tax=Arcicella rosea TaxID=502909 RepID=A0A841EUI1_9BACT|nr:hypothetical protein [Arcicella rosea]MBB6004298.1 putative tellurium resistance membrane protein TerC [Arcicella rosea]
MKEKLKNQKLLVLGIVFMILFNFPILSIVNHDTKIKGIPTLYFYVFVIWILFIGIIYWSVRNEEQEINKDE